MIFIAKSKLDDTFRNSEFNQGIIKQFPGLMLKIITYGVQTEMQAVADF
jgi:hypothetical protein